MKPWEFIGHNAFRTVESKRWPPTKKPCFAAWLRHRDGTEVLYLRGTASRFDGQLSDIQAHEAFGEGSCHRCVSCISYGRLDDAGDYTPAKATDAKG